MEIATIINCHGNTNCVLDTVESVKHYVGDRVLLLVDGHSWDWACSFEAPVHKLCGFEHNIPRSPYRNVALGLDNAYSMWKDDVEWFCYTEFDVLFCSDRFRHNLKLASERKIWMMGSDGRIDHHEMEMIESLVGKSFGNNGYYLIGCCQFFHRDFLAKLESINFFERFLNLTNAFPKGEMPGFTGYDLSEHMYPTLARHFGGNIGVLGSWRDQQWHGAYEYFPIRWRPEIDPITEDFDKASIIHPLKSENHPIRKKHREIRRARGAKPLW